LESQKASLDAVVQTLLNTKALDPKNRTDLDESIQSTQLAVLAKINELLNKLGE